MEQPAQVIPIKPILHAYYFSETQPSGIVKEEARLQAIISDGSSFKIRFRLNQRYVRQYVERQISRANLDEMLDLCNAHSTNSLYEKECTLLNSDDNLVGVELPRLCNRKKPERYLEIKLNSHVGLKDTTKIPARVDEVIESLDEFKVAASRYKNIIINWTPFVENYTGPVEPIKLNQEARLEWVKNFGQPIYRSGIFNKPFFVILQDNAIVGIEYGIRPNIESKPNKTDIEISDICFELPKQKIDTSGLPKVKWNDKEWFVAPYYVSELTDMIKGNPQTKLTTMLACATELQTIYDGNREILLFDDQSPVKSMTILNGNIHEISLNRKLDAKIWEKQSLEMMLYKSSSQRDKVSEKKSTRKKGTRAKHKDS